MNLNQSLDKFCKIINIANNINLISTDLRIVAVKELNIDIMKEDYSKDNYESIEDALALLKNRGIIFNFEKIDNGFKIFPQNKIYACENDLIIKFNEEKLIDKK